jgi:hypothetical protein
MFACTMGANCSVKGCKIKAVIDGRGLCYNHGENKRYCREPGGCDNLIQNQFKCIIHGAKKIECKFDGCSNKALKDGYCRRHGGCKCTIAGCNRPLNQSGMCFSHLKKEKEKLMCVPVPNDPCPETVVPLQVPGMILEEVLALKKVEGDAVLVKEGWKEGCWAPSLLAFTALESIHG